MELADVANYFERAEEGERACEIVTVRGREKERERERESELNRILAKHSLIMP